MPRALLSPILLALTLAAGAAAAETHPFSVHDMLAMDRISDPQVSPDGGRVLFTVSATDLDANRRRTDLWMVQSDGTGLRRLTSHEANDDHGRWAPDGRSVWFLSSRSGSSQVWRMAVDGGEAEQVTRLAIDVDELLVSRDGTRLLIALEVFPGAGIAETRKRLDEQEERQRKGPSGRLYDRLFVRHWDRWEDGRRSHLFALPATGGEPVDLMRDLDADAPTQPFGDAGEIDFTPDGRGVVFTAKDAGREEAWSTDNDLFLAPLDGSAPPRKLTTDNRAWDTGPVFSPDGRTLAYRAMAEPGYEADRLRILLRTWPDGPTRELAPGWDRSADGLAWSPDGRTLIVSAENLGQSSLFAIDVASGRVRTVVERGTAGSPAFAAGRIVYALDDLRSPVELWSVRPDGRDPRPLTRLNASKVAAARMGEPEPFTFTGAAGATVHGYVVKPVDFDPARRYPVAFLIHGGPQGSFGNHFHYRWNPQAYAGAGYAVVTVDFHGSTGYGKAFTDAIQDDWGGKPFEDLQKGLAAALERHPWMDGERVAALGASYGGYMINWISGRWPDRFRCLVVHDGNLDERMAYFDTEELWFPERDHAGTPWDRPEGYGRHNPVDFVKEWRTPTLVIHGGRDYRVVDTQGIGTFNALQRRGVPSRFLHFPDENHWVLKPRNSILWHETVLSWLDQWTRR